MKAYALAWAFAAALAQVEKSSDIDPALQTIAEARISEGKVAGLVIGTIFDDRMRVQGFGSLKNPETSAAHAQARALLGVLHARMRNAGEPVSLPWRLEQSFGETHIAQSGMAGAYPFHAVYRDDGKRGAVMLVPAGADLAGLQISPLFGGLEYSADLRTVMRARRQYEGRYQLAPDLILSVTATPDGLMAQATGQGPYRIFADGGDDKFAYRAIKAGLAFTRGANDKVNGLVLHYDDATLPAGRLP